MPGESAILAGRYQLLDMIGEGGAATVYLSLDRQMDRHVAVKVLRKSLGRSEVLRKRFQREALAMASFSHPNIVAIHDSGEDDGQLYLVMELVEGRSMSDVLRESKIDLNTGIALLEKVARAVGKAHEKGIVHRDLKPANILVNKNGEPKVGDFGLAHLMDSSTVLTKTGSTVGTPIYMAPEQVDGKGKNITPRTDVYALGVLLYEMLTGRPPHIGETAMELFGKIVSEEPLSPRRIDGGLPWELEAICLRAISKDPGRRFANGTELADDFRRYLDGEPIRSQLPSFLYKMNRRLARKKAVVGAVAAVLLIAGVVAGFVLPGLVEKSKALEDKEAESEALKRARPHLDAGRELLQRLDRMLMTKEVSGAQVGDLAEKARKEFSLALRETKDLPEALLETARAFRMEGRKEKAIEYCSKAVAAGPKFSTAYLERALLRLEKYAVLRHTLDGRLRNETPEAAKLRGSIERDLGEVRTWSQNKSELTFGEGMLLFAEGKYAESAVKLEEYARESMADPRGWYWAGRAWSMVRKEKKGMAALTRALKYRPLNYEYLTARGTAHQRAGEVLGRDGRMDESKAELEAALVDYSDAIKVNPHRVEAFGNRGIVNKLLGRFKKAISDFDKALKINRNSPTVYLNRANALSAGGDLDAAIRDYNRVLALAPFDADGYIDRGAAYYAKAGRLAQRGAKREEIMAALDRSIADYSEGIKLSPEDPIAWFNRAFSRKMKGEYDKAIFDFSKAIRLKPRFPLAYANRGLIFGQKGDLKKAVRDFEKALKQAPKTWPYRANIKSILEDTRRRLGPDQ